MLDILRFQNFKSWRDTGEIRFAPITGFFGTNSSGKSSILQFLLMLKQTVESNDQQRVLHLGSDHTYVDLGTSYDILHQQITERPSQISFSLSWSDPNFNNTFRLPTNVVEASLGPGNSIPFLGDPVDKFNFEAVINMDEDEMLCHEFSYSYFARDRWHSVGMHDVSTPNFQNAYELTYAGVPEQIAFSREGKLLPPPVKSYGFPSDARAYFQAGEFTQELSLLFEQVFQRLFYLGPLRDFPKRSYTWSGEKPQDVGRRGELAVAALLAAKKRDPEVEIKVASWLKKLKLVDDFQVQPIAPNRRDYEVRLCSRPNSAKAVLITDVGFGVSQILPVLVLCYYAPEGSTVILEQPEIHLHPFVQAGLADLFVEVSRERNLQIIIESHSEHLLRRLQRRIAEAKLITYEQTALYFCDMDDAGASHLIPLALDEFGNINNWPQGFFGDEMGDLVAMTEAAMQRQMAGDAS